MEKDKHPFTHFAGMQFITFIFVVIALFLIKELKTKTKRQIVKYLLLLFAFLYFIGLISLI